MEDSQRQPQPTSGRWARMRIADRRRRRGKATATKARPLASDSRDLDTALRRVGTRDYDPSRGRWTSGDPLPFGLSRCVPREVIGAACYGSGRIALGRRVEEQEVKMAGAARLA